MTNLKIQLNASIIQRLKSHDLYVDHMGTCLAIMLALQEKRYDLLDEFDDSNRNKRAILIYRQLELRGFLEPAVEHHFRLTKKAEVLLDFVRSEYIKDGEEFTIETLDQVEEIPVRHEPVETVSDWINDYISIFPDAFRDHPKIATKRMEEFINQYGYDKQTILGATRMYISEQENSPSGHQYTRRSIYFIYKGVGSAQICDLATWCKKYVDKGKTTDLDMNFMNMA